MRRLDFDLVRRSARWPGWAVGVVGLALAVDATSQWLDLQHDVDARAARGSLVAARALPAEPMTEETRREYDAARRLLLELALPWDRLFRSIEGALGADTALLAVEPDAAKQVLQLSGEARDFQALLAFMARLEDDRTLTRVHLLHHELREDAVERPTAFTLAAHWRAAP